MERLSKLQKPLPLSKSLYLLTIQYLIITYGRVTKGTSTKEDGIIIEEKKVPLSKGPDPHIRKGPNILNMM